MRPLWGRKQADGVFFGWGQRQGDGWGERNRRWRSYFMRVIIATLPSLWPRVLCHMHWQWLYVTACIEALLTSLFSPLSHPEYSHFFVLLSLFSFSCKQKPSSDETAGLTTTWTSEALKLSGMESQQMTLWDNMSDELSAATSHFPKTNSCFATAENKAIQQLRHQLWSDFCVGVSEWRCSCIFTVYGCWWAGRHHSSPVALFVATGAAVSRTVTPLFCRGQRWEVNEVTQGLLRDMDWASPAP